MPNDRPVEHCAWPEYTEAERRELRTKRWRTMKRGLKHPSSIKELQAIVAASTVPIKRYGLGVPTYWEPSWFEGNRRGGLPHGKIASDIYPA